LQKYSTLIFGRYPIEWHDHSALAFPFSESRLATFTLPSGKMKDGLAPERLVGSSILVTQTHQPEKEERTFEPFLSSRENVDALSFAVFLDAR
jgi:hypothetical protein